MDSLDNIYLVGHGSYGDIYLVKLNPFGTQLWNRIWGGAYEERAKTLALDSTDNVYVLGTTKEGLEPIYLLKFSSTGSLQ